MEYAASGGFGAATDLDVLIYGESHPNLLTYLGNQFTNLSNTLMAPAKEFLNQARNIFEECHGSRYVQYARDMIGKVTGNTDINIDRICALNHLHSVQNAGLIMQRWIMANPVVRQMYHDQRCDGFSSSYYDTEPGRIGDDHYDYRLVNDGIVHVTQDGWKATQYDHNLKEGDRALTFSEKLDVMDTWRTLEHLIAVATDDPTDPQGGSL